MKTRIRFMSSSQFYTVALSRELDRRRFGYKVCSISKEQIETWIEMKMTADLKNEPMRDFIHIKNGKRGMDESYGWVKFTDEIMERLYELYDIIKEIENRKTIRYIDFNTGSLLTLTPKNDNAYNKILEYFQSNGYQKDWEGVWMKQA